MQGHGEIRFIFRFEIRETDFMKHSNEINALFHLLDDPDTEIYETVSKKILHYGKDIIPNLENLWEKTTDQQIQERIETLIHRVNLSDFTTHFEQWKSAEQPNLLDGMICLSHYQYPDLNETSLRKTIKNIYQSCWLELNNYLTPLEQITIINSIFYSMYKFKGYDLDANKPHHFFINEVIDTHSGNNYSLGSIYQALCEMLDIPVFCIQLPHQFLLAYFDTRFDPTASSNSPFSGIQFYIDPNSGTIYSQNDVNVYIKKYGFEIADKPIHPLSNLQIMNATLEALVQVYEQLGDIEKAKELHHFIEFNA